MTTKDVAAVTLKALAVWWIANGVAGLCSALLTWKHDAAESGAMVSTFTAAASGIFIPIGMLVWFIADWVAGRIGHASPGPIQVAVDRNGLYAFASVLVGLFLVSDALPQVVYWIVVWRMSRGTGFWSAASEGTMGDTVVYWVAARGQVGVVATKLLLGLVLISGPERVKAAVARVRREFSDHIADEPKSGVEQDGDRGA